MCGLGPPSGSPTCSTAVGFNSSSGRVLDEPARVPGINTRPSGMELATSAAVCDPLALGATDWLSLLYRWKPEIMDNLQSLDPRKQELLEARFIGNRTLSNSLPQSQHSHSPLTQSLLPQGSMSQGSGIPGGPVCSPAGLLTTSHGSSGTGSNHSAGASISVVGVNLAAAGTVGMVPGQQLNTNHNQDSNMSTASLGSQHSDKEPEVVILTPEKIHRTPNTAERKRKRKEDGSLSGAVKGPRGDGSVKKINEYFKHQVHSPSRFGGSKSPTSQGYYQLFPHSPQGNPLPSPTGAPVNSGLADYSSILASMQHTQLVTQQQQQQQQQQQAQAQLQAQQESGDLLEEDCLVFESGGSESSFVFNDAKRKLRMVLGSADVQTLPWLTSSNTPQARLNGPKHRENDLVAFLKVLLAEAINLQQRPLVAHLHEALRCIRMFDNTGCQKLLNSLKVDYRRRAPYISYLVRCRQGLLSTLAHLEALQGRIRRDKDVCSKYLITLCVRTFLEKREKNIEMFLRKFQALTVADEMAQLVEKFLSFLYSAMDTDPLWQTASQSQLDHAHTVIERTVMSQIYIRALYPNGDGDALRDQVFYQHMQKLSMVITLDHKDLRIPKMYHHECPWPSAQAEIITINAYKTPRDKIQCVLRCCSTIMNLLSMAGNKSVPAADDFIPVLVYVLIKANPASLLSAKEYINTFYETQLEGEDAYWWTQFSSAVEFIKTMDY